MPTLTTRILSMLAATAVGALSAVAQVETVSESGLAEVIYDLRLGPEADPVRSASGSLIDVNPSLPDSSFAVSSGFNWFASTSTGLLLQNPEFPRGLEYVVGVSGDATATAPIGEVAAAGIAAFGRAEYIFDLSGFRIADPIDSNPDNAHNILRVFDSGGDINVVFRGPLNARGIEPFDLMITTADIIDIAWICTPSGTVERASAATPGRFLVPGLYEFYAEASTNTVLTAEPPQSSATVGTAWGVEASFLLNRDNTAIPPCFDFDGDPSRLSATDVVAWIDNPRDVNADGVIDQEDPLFLSYLVQLVGPFYRDCNDNGYPDQYDIAAGISLDVDGNNFPDECDASVCSPADLDFDNLITVFDLIAFLQSFSENNDTCIGAEGLVPCAVADVHPINPTGGFGGDGEVSVFDLIAFLQAFDPENPDCNG